MENWKRETLRLKHNHTWKTKSGYQIFIADEGAVRLMFPKDWVVIPAADCIQFYDSKPPLDNCRLAISYLRIPQVDWSELPLPQLMEVALQDDPRQFLSRGKIIETDRPHLELAWQELRFIEQNEHREAICRICLSRGYGIQSLITLDYWPEHEPQLCTVWKDVIDSLELGRHIADPSVGPQPN